MARNAPVTRWKPPGDIGEMSDGVSYDLVDQLGNLLVTQDGDNLTTGISIFTIKPDTIWNQLADFVNAIQDEMSLYILDEMGQPIEDESIVDGVTIPPTRWSPPVQGEMTNVSSNDLITQLGAFLVTQDGNMLITSDSLYTTTPATTYTEDDSM